MPTGKNSSSRVANEFFDSGVVPYGIPTYVLMDNGEQFFEQAARNAMHHSWHEAPNNNCLQFSNNLANQMEQSYNSHATKALCCQEPEELEHIRATFNLRMQSACAQVHK